MNQHLINLFAINYVDLALALATIVIGFVAIKKAVEEFCQTFGIKLRYLEEKQEMKKCQTEVKIRLAELGLRQDKFEKQHEDNIKARDKFNKEIMERIDALHKDIDAMREEIDRREAQKRFKKLRYDLLNFSDKIVRCESVSAEMISEIYDEIELYENLSKEYGFENGRVNVSISVIQQKYEELLKNGKVTR